jgi:beta-N-acetylhexosaminidase
MSARRGASSLGGLVAVGLEGTRVAAAEEKAILDHGVGAFILFERNLADAAQALRLVDALHELGRHAAGRPPLILIDDEGGLISEARRLGTPAPAAMALGALGEPGLVREWAWRTGRRLAVLGIGLVLAPVVDVNTERRNPVIGFRAYGDDPARVSRLGLAAMEGFRSAGVLPVPKHFPGHGGVSVDSHDRLPRFGGTLGEAELHLAPFRAMIEADAPAILAAHLAAPALARGSMTPASLSPEILTGLLREGMGFRGVVVTDDLAMGALSEACPAEEVPVRALAAGADLLLYASGFGSASDASPRGAGDLGGGAEAALRALDRALAEGVLPEARVEEALARLDALAQASDEALAGATEGSCRAAGARAREETLAAFEADDRAARAHLTAVLATGPVALPVAPGTALLLPTELEGRRKRSVPWPREAGLATAGLVTEVLRFPYNPDEDEVDALLGALGPERPAVIGLVARAGLPQGQADLAARILSRPGPTLPVALLNPFVLDGLSSKSAAGPSAPDTGIGTGLATFGFEPEEMAGLARVLGGHARPLG